MTNTHKMFNRRHPSVSVLCMYPRTLADMHTTPSPLLENRRPKGQSAPEPQPQGAISTCDDDGKHDRATRGRKETEETRKTTPRHTSRQRNAHFRVDPIVFVPNEKAGHTGNKIKQDQTYPSKYTQVHTNWGRSTLSPAKGRQSTALRESIAFYRTYMKEERER